MCFNLRKFKLLAVSWVAAWFLTTSLFASTMGVFIPGIKSASGLSGVLRGEKAFEGVEVFVFSKYKDFKIALKTQKFDFILTNSYYLNYTGNKYERSFQFSDDGSDTFSYLLIALEKNWKNQPLTNATVTAVQTLERRDMNKFINESFRKRKFKRIKNISKAEDLFPILAMKNADVALATPKMVQDIRDTYPTEPIKVLESIEIKHLVLAKRKDSKATLPAAESLSKKSLAAMRVSGVKKAI